MIRSSFFLLACLVAFTSCQLNFNDIPRPNYKNNAFVKTIDLSNAKIPGVKTSSKDSKGYLPPEPYLPPEVTPLPSNPNKVPIRPNRPNSTPGPLYLPVVKVTYTTKYVTYMPPTNTFPPMRNYTYTTYSTTTQKYRPPPPTLSPFTTTIRTTTAYNYDTPDKSFTAEDILPPKRG